MSTHKLFKKHFGDQIAVDLKHPNMEKFFTDLNNECLQEDKEKYCQCTHNPPIRKIETGAFICYECEKPIKNF
jgi:hypothetical protein